MQKSKSVAERLKAIKLQGNINNHLNVDKAKNEAEENLEEYPKMRKPKPSTLLKIQARQAKTVKPETKAKALTEDPGSLQVPLRKEFLNRKQQLEKATSNLMKKYEVRKSQGTLLDADMFSQDSKETQPLTLRKELDLQFKELDLKCQASDTNSLKKDKELNFLEQHLVNILYTKVQAHHNGFFAENLPNWYKKTFDKDISSDWLELLERSRKFYIEMVQNKIVLYTKRSSEEFSIDLKASGDKKTTTQDVLAEKPKEPDVGSESSVGVVRYKHLQKSLQKYAQNAGRNLAYGSKSNENFIKPSDRLNKSTTNKKLSFVKK